MQWNVKLKNGMRGFEAFTAALALDSCFNIPVVDVIEC